MGAHRCCRKTSRRWNFTPFQYAVDQSPFETGFRSHEIIAVKGAFHLFIGATAMFGIKTRHQPLGSLRFLGMDEDIRCLPLKATGGLVDKQVCVGKGRAMTGFPAINRKEPIERAVPMQSVCTGART